MAGIRDQLIHRKLGMKPSDLIDSVSESMLRLLVYYGYPSSYKELYDNNLVIQDISNYGMWLCGDTYHKPSHEDYANTTEIIAGVRDNGVLVYGYVPIGGNLGVNRTLEEQKQAVDEWRALGVDGIFLDEFGFDYGQNRQDQVNIVSYVKEKGLPYVANAWVWCEFYCDHIDEIPFPSNDWRYTRFASVNPNNIPLPRDSSDWYMFENFVSDNTGLATKFDLHERVNDLTQWLVSYPSRSTKRMFLSVCPESPAGTVDLATLSPMSSVEEYFKYHSACAVLHGANAVGLGGFSFGAAGTPVSDEYYLLPNEAAQRTSLTINLSTGVNKANFGDIELTVTTDEVGGTYGFSYTNSKKYL